MDKDFYRFIVRCLGWSIVLIVIASITFGLLKFDAGQLGPILAPVGALLGGLLVVPQSKYDNTARQRFIKSIKS